MGNVETAARQLYGAQKADGRIPQGHSQRVDLEQKLQTYEQDFNATILNLFDKVLFPIQRAGRSAQLVSKAPDMTRDTEQPFDGEVQIEKTLTSNPLKLYLDVEKDFDPIRDKAQDLLWPENQDEARWADVADRYTDLGTNVCSFSELVDQPGVMRFGHRPRVADTFCGSGQIPFETARLGCDVYTSDLSLEPGYYRQHNPIVRHTVLRRRTLEEAGLLDKVAIAIHPDPQQPADIYTGVSFAGLGLRTNHPFDLAYQAAEDFTAALQQRIRAAGFMKTLLLQRICSSFASGKATAEKLLRGDVLEEEDEMPMFAESLSTLTPTEASHLRTIIEELARPEARHPKLAAVTSFLTEYRTEDKTWLEHGCIIFSQYYDTARWVAAALAKVLPNAPVAVYAGTGKSSIFRGDAFASVDREDIKKAVKQRGIRLVVATDAACEGLNLQTLGTLINVDLP